MSGDVSNWVLLADWHVGMDVDALVAPVGIHSGKPEHQQADGAHKLNCSERNVKYIFQGVICRFSLRNHSHAAAFALRTGVL